MSMMKIIGIDKVKDEITIQMDEYTVLTLNQSGVSIEYMGDDESTILNYDFDDLQIMNDAIRQINYPKDSQIKKLIAENKTLKEENRELKATPKAVSVPAHTNDFTPRRVVKVNFVSPEGFKKFLEIINKTPEALYQDE